MAEPDQSREPLIRKDSPTMETDRDPKQINQDVFKVNFEDVIAEPADTHSLDQVWKASNTTFTMSKCCLYRSLTAIFGVPLSLLWGFLFACLSFWRIWAVVPCIKSCLIGCQCLILPYLQIIRSFLAPLSESLGKMFGSMRAVLRKEV